MLDFFCLGVMVFILGIEIFNFLKFMMCFGEFDIKWNK